jgi:Fe-S cluster assembly protein SufD
MTTTNTKSTITEATVRSLSQQAGEPAWLLQRRLDAWRAFEAMEMPSPAVEEWRRTDLSGIDLDTALAAEPPLTSDAYRLYQGDEGEQSPDLPPGVVFTSLSNALKTHEKLVEPLLHSLVLPEEWKLQALAAALRQDGAFIYVPSGVEVELPLHVALSTDQPFFAPHILIVAGDNSKVTVIQETASQDETAHLVSGAIEVFAGPYARVHYYDMEGWGAATDSFTTLRAKLDRGAELTTVTAGLGGKLTRSKVEALLEGEGSQADLLGVSFGDGSQHFDYQTLQDHIGPRTRSDLLYKAALTGKASEVWYGTARIHKGAAGSDANQTSRNLLLSDSAKAAPIPVLEIEAYDILRCSHGATAGPLDEEQAFYLESRGIDPKEAERLLVGAFFQPVLDRIEDEPLRKRVQNALARKIGHGEWGEEDEIDV